MELNLELRPMSFDLVEPFWQAVDSVARERKYLAFLQAPPIDTTRQFVLEFIEKEWTQIVALEGSQVVGWCDVCPFEFDGLAHGGRLGMGVISPWRGRGLGRRLIRTAIEDALAKGLTRIELEVFASNTTAIALYEKVGFKHEGRKRLGRFLDGLWDDILIMGLLKDEARL